MKYEDELLKKYILKSLFISSKKSNELKKDCKDREIENKKLKRS